MNNPLLKRLSILLLVTLVALLATWGTLAASPPDAIVLQKQIVGNVTTAQPGDVITYRIGVWNNGGATASILMTDTLPTGVRLIDKPIGNLLQGNSPSNYTRDIRNRTVGFKADFDAGTQVEILLPVRVGRCYDTTDKTITNSTVVSNVNGAGSVSDSVSFTVDCSGTTSLNQLEWSADFADAPYDGAARGWDEGVAAIKGRFLRLQFKNNGSARLDFNLDLRGNDIRPTLGWTGCLTCTRAADTGHLETIVNSRFEVRVNPGDTYLMDFYVEPSSGIMFETSLPLDIDLCLPDFDDADCDGGGSGKTQNQQLTYILTHRDLGDAPDSTNHAGAVMAAYAGTPANFPTVHDAALGAPQGPVHLNSARFHLGNGVSAEFEADIGPDQDPANNIEPSANVADLDSADDGVLPNAWSFVHCQPTTIPVRVFIHPTAVAAYGDNPAYINIWTDSNRDGDWGDAANCGGNPAPEHIVIDAQVDVAALGAGIHTVNVTTGRVPWPAAQANNPAWARVMLTGVPAVKLAGETYGDGRGRALPYASGETEDYLINNPQQLGVAVQGNFANEDGDKVNWRIRYVNRSDHAIENFSLDINLPDQAVARSLCNNEVVCAVDGSGLHVTGGSLAAGARGTVWIRTDAIAGQNVSAIAIGEGDNAAQVTESETLIGIKPEIIIESPVDGMMSGETELEVIGRITNPTASRAPLQLYWDDTFLQTLTPKIDGTFVYTTPLTATLRSAGHHKLRVVSGDVETSSSLIVNPALGFDIATMRVSLPGFGRVYAPFGEDGRLDANGWRIITQGNSPHTITVRSDATNMRIRYEDGTVVPMVVPEGEPCVFTVALQPQSRATVQKLQIEALDADGNISIAEGTLIQADKLINIVDMTTGQPLAGVTVTKRLRPASVVATLADWSSYGPRALDTLSVWKAPANTASESDQNGHAEILPSRHDLAFLLEIEGYQSFYGLETPTTSWTGCLTCTRSVDALATRTVALAPVQATRATVDIEIDSTGFNPAYVEVTPGTVINFVNIDSEDHGTTSDLAFNTTYDNGAWASGSIPSGDTFAWQMNVAGEFTYSDPNSPFNIGTIVVTGTPTAVEVSQQVAVNSEQWILFLLVGLVGMTILSVKRYQDSSLRSE